MKKLFATLGLLGVLGTAHAEIEILTEGFGSVPGLTGSGWAIIDANNPANANAWFQGNAGVFPAQSGPDDSYAASNFLQAGPAGDVSTWLITPTITFGSRVNISFYARSDVDPAALFSDSLRLHLSSAGGSTTLSDFSTLVFSINPTQTPGAFPAGWTQYVVGLGGFADGLTGRLAFEYIVDATNLANYVGIDTVSVYIPEPTSTFLLGVGMLALTLVLARKRNR